MTFTPFKKGAYKRRYCIVCHERIFVKRRYCDRCWPKHVKDYKNKWAKDKRANASPKFCTICNAKLLDHRAVRCDQCRKKYNQEYRSNWAKEKAKQGVGK